MRKRSEVLAERRSASEESPSGRPDETPPPAESAREVAEAVVETSRKLAEEMSRPAEPYDWPSANAAKAKPLPKAIERMATTIVNVDVEKEWAELEAALSLGEKRAERAHVKAALERAAAMASKAHRVYMAARELRAAWELENEVIHGAMWSAATVELQAEKVQGIRSKQITDEDVRKRVATKFPDEYQAQEKRRRRFEYVVKHLGRLAEIWDNRQRDLSAMQYDNPR